MSKQPIFLVLQHFSIYFQQFDSKEQKDMKHVKIARGEGELEIYHTIKVK